MDAKQAIERSESHDEIVTLENYSEDDFQTLCVECDSNVLANGVWEFWAHEEIDPDAQCKEHGCARHHCDADHQDMAWRVHMPAANR